MTLNTDDLILRTVEMSDIEEVARMWDFEKKLISTKEAKEAIEYMHNNHEKNKPGTIYHLCFAVFIKGSKRIIGWCGLDGTTAGKLHIFYLIDKAYRNNGYATQCAERLLSYAFNEAHVPFVNGGCAKDNIASYKVMTKIGMKENGYETNGDPLFFIDDGMYHETSGGNNA